MSEYSPWNTTTEMQYLKTLGTSARTVKIASMKKSELLAAYIKGIQKRADNIIDVNHVIGEANRMMIISKLKGE